MWQFAGQCYGTPQAANEAAAAAVSGTVQDGYAIAASAVTPTSITYEATNISTGAVLMRVVAVDPQPCGLMQREEAMELAWAVAAVLLSVGAVTFLGRVVWHAVTNWGNQGET
ncbi:hypothetical protein [Acidovorax sp. SDU_ACID1]|uniref:hypothetical protein n=1 Tax=Acidovorax sp. SDU_ACID1 TaxID=3136632 RepID=UPI003872CB34